MTLPLLRSRPSQVPAAPFVGLSALWIQITGTWCNLECTHCLNASGPREPWLRPVDAEAVRDAIQEGERLGVKEIYFTGGEPFLHAEILTLLGEALAVAPTTVLTNGTKISDAVADALADLAAPTPYSLEIRVSLDDVDPRANDQVRVEAPDGRHRLLPGANVWYAVLTAGPELDVEFVPVHYEYETLAREIEQEGLPAEFAETVRTGWWTTCLENLPVKERVRGKF